MSKPAITAVTLLLFLAAAPDARTAEGPALPPAEVIADPGSATGSQDGGADATEGAGVTQLEDIVVTATKREKSERDVPVSLTVLRGESLEKIGAREVKDYIMLAPGISLDENENGQAAGRRMSMRGVGPGQNGFGNQTVGQFIGDAPMGDPYSNYGIPDVDPFDLSTVEILRGPQGTTFGASALNGAIRYVPNDPVLGEWSGRGFVDGVAVHEGGIGRSYGAAINAPIGDTLAIRASGIGQFIPGVYDHNSLDLDDSDSGKKSNGRVAARWEPTERFSANLMYLHQRTRSDDVLVADNPDGRLENDEKAALSYIDFGFNMASADLRYRLDDWGTVVLQGTRQSKLSDGSIDTGQTFPLLLSILLPIPPQTTAAVTFFTEADSQTYEARLVSPEGGNWDWIVGAFRRDYEAEVAAGIDTDMFEGLQSAEIVPLDASENALFAELVRRFGPRWEVTLGARHYDTTMDGVFVGRFLGTELYRQPIEQEDDGINPKLSVAYKASRNLMAYATVARGFQYGGVNAGAVTAPGVPESFDSSVLWSREVGVRTDWLDRTLRADLAVYDISWKDAQLMQLTPTGTAYTDNVGDVSSRGVETTLKWLTPVPGLSTSLAASYTRSVTASAYDNGVTVTEKGTEMPATPRWQTAVTVDYNTSFGPWLTGASLVHTHWGEAYDNIDHTNEIYDFGLLGLNLSASRGDLKNEPTMTLGVANLTDKRGVVGRAVSPAPTWTYTRPRAVSLCFSLAFG